MKHLFCHLRKKWLEPRRKVLKLVVGAISL